MSAPTSSQTTLPTEYTTLLNELNRTIHRERPRDILQFCANWFNKRLEEQRVELINHSSYDPRTPLKLFCKLTLDSSLPQVNTRRAQTETIFEEPFAPTSPRSSGPPPSSQVPPTSPTSLSFLSQDPNPTDFPPNYNLSRRTSVSAESLAPQTSPQIRRTSQGPTKTAQQETRIRSAISANLLFKNLDDEQTRDVLDAMSEKRIPKEGFTVIHQGDVGDFFYVVEEGNFDFYIRKQGGNVQGLGDRVGGVGAGGSFGELALMYNAPRAASVVSTSAGVLWALDRITFRKILMDVIPLLVWVVMVAYF
jgi:cAMP-dependent protein kinase regulator